MNNRSRIEWIDTLRGIMMFFVVWGHSLSDQYIGKYIFSFHMPAFFIISGMTFAFNKETNFFKYAFKKIKGLIIPYFCLNALVAPLWYVNRQLSEVSYQSFTDLLKGVLVSNVESGFKMASNTTWFITCLFLTDILFFVISRASDKDSALIGVSAFVYGLAFTAGIITDKQWGIWHWQVAFSAFVFYLGGYLFMKNIEAVKACFKKTWIIFAVSAALLLLGAWASLENSRISMVNNRYGKPVIFFFSAFCTSLSFALAVMKLSDHKLFSKAAWIFNYVGRNTLVYIAFHVPIIRFIQHFIPALKSKNDIYRFIMAAAVFIIILPLAWLTEKYLPVCVGKKKKILEKDLTK